MQMNKSALYDDPNIKILLEYERTTDGSAFKNPKEVKADRIKCRHIYRAFKDNYYTNEDMKTLEPLLRDYPKLIEHELYKRLTREGKYYFHKKS